jgi:CubicO group peptidase (beta-lactamase class C family)
METFTSEIRQAVGETDPSSKKIPGVAFAVVNGSGEFLYNKAFGNISVAPGSKPLKTDTVFWLASCTKLIVSVAALQCVERGLLTLDGDDILSVLPELRNPKILEGFDEAGEPIYKDTKKTITLRFVLKS